MSYDGLDLSILQEILPSNKLLEKGSARHINPVLLSFADIAALDELGESSFFLDLQLLEMLCHAQCAKTGCPKLHLLPR
jgi:hypothetical protein